MTVPSLPAFAALPPRLVGLLVATLCLGGCGDRTEGGEVDAETDRIGADAGADSLLVEGEALYRAGAFGDALPLLEEARRTALADEDSAAAAVATTWMGEVHRQLGDYATARRLGEEALSWKQRLGLEDELAQSFNALGLLAWYEGRLRDALDLHERSLAAAQAVADSTGMARSYTNLGLVRTDLGELTRAAERYGEAREAFAALGRPELEGRVLTNLGALYMEWGDAVRADEALTEAFARYAEADDPVGELNALGQLGVVRAAQGDPERGLQLLDSALVRARELELPWEEASNLEQLANIHAALGSIPLALDLYEQANALNVDLGLVYEEGANLRARSALHREQGNAPLGLELMGRALAAHREIEAGGEVLLDLLEMALLAGAADLPDQVGERLAEAAEWAAMLASPRAEISVALARASLASDDGRWSDVLSALEGVGPRLPDAPADLRWQAELLRARALDASGGPGALDAAREAVALVEQLRSSLTSDLLRNSVARHRAETYHLLVDLLLDRGQIEAAFEAAEASRGRAVARRVAAASLGSDRVDPGPEAVGETEELLVRLSHLESALDDLYAWTAPDARGADFERQANELREQREEARRRLTRRLAQRTAPGGSSHRAWVSLTADTDSVRVHLGPREALLSFLETDDRLLTFVVRRDGVTHRVADLDLDDLTGRVRVTRALVAEPRPLSGAHRTALSGWHELLLGPLERDGVLEGVDHLLVATDGPLAYLPMAALFDMASGRFLVQRYSLQDIPSAAALVALRSDSGKQGPDSPVGVGFAPEPDGLPASAGEVERFASSFPGETFVGPAATESRMRDALAAGAVVHAAAHGRMNVRNPLFSSVRLTPGAAARDDDGILYVHEMLDLSVAAPLVFLSGCDTGAASAWAPGVVGGRDLATLAEALLFAGADAVVATLWPIQDQPAAEFAGHFYDSLRDTPPARALAEAQRRMLSDPDTRAPFYWAGYRVSGKGR